MHEELHSHKVVTFMKGRRLSGEALKKLRMAPAQECQRAPGPREYFRIKKLMDQPKIDLEHHHGLTA